MGDNITAAQRTQSLEMLVAENAILKTWVKGLLSGCEGCTNQATAWATALGDAEAEAEHEEEVS